MSSKRRKSVTVDPKLKRVGEEAHMNGMCERKLNEKNKLNKFKTEWKLIKNYD
jgi:hypothetical protein